MAALQALSALEAAAAVRAREVSPTELVEHSLDRIGRLDDQLGAFVTVTAARARAEAAAADPPAASAPGPPGWAPSAGGPPTARGPGRRPPTPSSWPAASSRRCSAYRPP